MEPARRDLSKPVGALNPVRLEEFRKRQDMGKARKQRGEEEDRGV